MIQIVSAAGVSNFSQEDFLELIEMAEEGMRAASQYDMSSDLSPFPDPAAEAERQGIINKCRAHIEEQEA